MVPINLLSRLLWQCQGISVIIGKMPIVFAFLWSIIIAVTGYLGRFYVRIICSIFLLYMESDVLEKSTKKGCINIFRTNSFDDSLFNQILGSSGSISWKAILIVLEFSQLRLLTNEKQGIINLSCNRSKRYAWVAIPRSSFLYIFFFFKSYFLHTRHCIVYEVYHQISLSSMLQQIFHEDL